MRFSRRTRWLIVAVLSFCLIGTAAVFFIPGLGNPGSTPESSISAEDYDPDEVMATVNGRAITMGEVFEAMYAQLGSQVVEQKITEILIEQEANRVGISVDDEEIEEELERFAESYGGRESLELLLAQQGMSIEDLKDNLRVNLLVEKLLAPEIDVSDEEMREFYQEEPERFSEPEQVQARHILVETEEEALALRDRIESGEDFAKLAEEHSLDASTAEAGGDLGWFRRGDMDPSFEEAAFTAEVGTLVGPVESQYGVHLIEVLERREANARSFEEARQEIEELLFQRKLQERVGAWLQELRAEADVRLYR